MAARTPQARPRPAGGRFGRDILPLLAGYWSFGQYWGVWVILVFEFQLDHGVSDARIGVDYMLLSIVSVAVMVLLAPRLQQVALSTSVPLSLGSLAVAALAIGFLSGPVLLIGFALVGLGNGLIDIYLNVAAQRVEIRTGRPVLQWLHASYALGGVTGAAAAGAIRAAGIDYRMGFGWVTLALLGTALWTARTMSRARSPAETRAALSLSALVRTPALLVPALIVLSAFLVEGSMDTWSGLYVRDELGASASAAAAAFMGYSAAVFLGRLFAGRVLFGMGRRSTVLVAGLGAAASGTLAVIADHPAVVGVAFLLLGFTISAASPAGFGLIEEMGTREDATHAIAAVTTIGYTGFVWSPPLLGWIADAVSLRAAMAVIVVATGGIVLGGLLAPRRRAP
jgi:sugar phosphate permease